MRRVAFALTLASVLATSLMTRSQAQGPSPAAPKQVAPSPVAAPNAAPTGSAASGASKTQAPVAVTPPTAKPTVSPAAPVPQSTIPEVRPPTDAVSAQQLLNELQSTDDPYTTTLLQTRDPFNPPPVVAEAAIEKTELEQVPLEQIKITGIITGLNQHKAILVTPNGKTHIVGEKTKIGTRKGIVKKITANSVVVRERFANVFGKEENIDTEIKMIEKKEKR